MLEEYNINMLYGQSALTALIHYFSVNLDSSSIINGDSKCKKGILFVKPALTGILATWRQWKQAGNTRLTSLYKLTW